jgi:hypothetical protein
MAWLRFVCNPLKKTRGRECAPKMTKTSRSKFHVQGERLGRKAAVIAVARLCVGSPALTRFTGDVV